MLAAPLSVLKYREETGSWVQSELRSLIEKVALYAAELDLIRVYVLNVDEAVSGCWF